MDFSNNKDNNSDP